MNKMISSILLSLAACLMVSKCDTHNTRDYSSFDQWAKENAVLVKTLEPGSGFEDFSIVKDIVGDARVVGIGESEHSSHELMQERNKIIEYLVEELGFTAVAQETGFSESELIHNYVLGLCEEPKDWSEDPQSEDPKKIHAEGYTWGFGKEKEQLALVRWLRQYNQDPAHKHKVNFYGMDVALGYSSPLTSLEASWKYLDRVDPDYKDSKNRKNLRSLVESFLGAGGGVRHASIPKYKALPMEKQNAYKAELARLIAHFEINRVYYISKSSKKEYEWALRHAIAARQLNQGMEYYGEDVTSVEEFFSSRAYGQAENVRWALDQEGPEGRIIVFAHNTHIKKYGFEPWTTACMGTVLDTMFPNDYITIGSAHDRFISSPESGKAYGELPQYIPPDENSIIEALNRIGIPMYILNLKAAPKKGLVYEWLNQPRPWRTAANQVFKDKKVFVDAYIKIAEAYDAIFFIKELTHSHR